MSALCWIVRGMTGRHLDFVTLPQATWTVGRPRAVGQNAEGQAFKAQTLPTLLRRVPRCTANCEMETQRGAMDDLLLRV